MVVARNLIVHGATRQLQQVEAAAHVLHRQRSLLRRLQEMGEVTVGLGGLSVVHATKLLCEKKREEQHEKER